jgi:hypothetical protein
VSDVDTRARDWRSKVDAIAAEIRDDLPLYTACRLHGVPRRTMEDAMRRDDPALAPIHAARAEIERKLAKRLDAHAEEGTPHGATSFKLERMYPDNWKPAERVEVSGPEGGPTQAEVKITLADAVAGARGDGER